MKKNRNQSEILLSDLSEIYFFKELVFDDLCYTPDGKSEVELADLIINFGERILVFQLKSRNEKDKTLDRKKEEKWFESSTKKAKKQIKDTIDNIRSGTLPSFKNKRKQSCIFEKDAEIIPLIVIDNDYFKDNYNHLLRSRSENGLDINCMTRSDYKEMCNSLCSGEVIDYLLYRERFYRNNGDADVFIDFNGPKMIVTKPRIGESLTHRFLMDYYGTDDFEYLKNDYSRMIAFLSELPHHIDVNYKKEGYYIIQFLAGLNREAMDLFFSNLDDTIKEAQRPRRNIVHTMRQKNDYSILFLTDYFLNIKCINKILPKKKRVKKVLQVLVYYETKEMFKIDYLLSNLE